MVEDANNKDKVLSKQGPRSIIKEKRKHISTTEDSAIQQELEQRKMEQLKTKVKENPEQVVDLFGLILKEVREMRTEWKDEFSKMKMDRIF